MRKFALVLPILFFLSFLGIPSQVALAACTSGSGTRDLNFRTSNEGGTITSGNGSWESGFGWRTGVAYSDGFTTGVRLFMEVDLGDSVDLTSSSNVTLTVSSSNVAHWSVLGYTADRAHSMTIINTTGGITGESTDNSGFSDPSNYQVRYLVFQSDHVQGSDTPYVGFAAVHLDGSFNCLPTAAFTYDPHSGPEPLEVDFTDTSNGNGNSITAWAWDFDNGDTSTEQNPTYTFADPGDYDVSLTVTNANGTSTISHTVSVAIGDGLPGGNLFKPLADADIDHTFFDGIFDTSDVVTWRPPFYDVDPLLTAAMSNQPGDDVYAVADGTVELVSPPGTFNCADAGLPELLSACAFAFNPGGDVSPSNDGGLNIYRIDISNAYLVRLSYGETEEKIVYLVQAADQYVYSGLILHAGCIIGQTLTLGSYQLGITIGPVTAGAPSANIGVTFINLYTNVDQVTVESLAPSLVLTTDPGLACNAEPEFATCMGSNPRFLNNGDGWVQRSGSIFFGDGGGVYLNPGAEAAMSMNLDPDIGYTVTAGGISITGQDTSTLLLRIGTALDTFPIDNITERVALEDTMPTGTIADGIYEVGVKNVGNSTVFVSWVCITEGGPPTNPGGCYFTNPTFDYEDSGWTVGANVFFPGDGTAIMADASDGTLAQAINLSPGDYTLTARVRAYYNIAVNQITSPTADIDLLYDLGDGEETLGNFVIAGSDAGNFNELTTSFTLSEVASGTITFYIDINSGSSELQGLNIDSLCLQKDGGYPPPTTGTPPPTFPSNCQVIPNPLRDDVPTWLAWQWAQFNRFFNCTLMVALNQVLKTLYSMLDFLRWQMLYWQAYLNTALQWISNTIIPWLSGNFANMANGRTTVIVQSGGDGCHDVFCLLEQLIDRVISPLVDIAHQIVDTLLSILAPALTLLLSLATTLLSLFISLFGAILQFFHQLSGLMQSLLAGINGATPTPLPGVPQCQLDPKSNPICIALWMLENTVFADEGQLYIPLLIGFISLMLILWGIYALRDELTKLGDKL